jgi:hypothetical protein
MEPAHGTLVLCKGKSHGISSRFTASESGGALSCAVGAVEGAAGVNIGPGSSPGFTASESGRALDCAAGDVGSDSNIDRSPTPTSSRLSGVLSIHWRSAAAPARGADLNKVELPGLSFFFADRVGGDGVCGWTSLWCSAPKI